MTLEQPSVSLLVVDDSRADVGLLQALLNQTRPGSFRLVHATTAEEGLQQLKDEPFDCVFLDYMLDENNGLEVLRLIRKQGNDIPVIAFSGCGSEEVAVEALQLGAQDYLVKGKLTAAAIERALRNAIEKVAMARQLAERQQELQDFAHVAAHDLNAPLRRIVGFSKWILDDFAENVDEVVIDKLNTIRSNAERMQQLLESLLEFTRVGRSMATAAEVDLNHVLRLTLENLEAVIEDEQGTVHVRDLPTVQGHEITLVQLFQNLLANAIKFRGDQPPRIEVSAQEHPHGWEISVADQGIGIEEEFLHEIFAPFRRLHTNEEYEGAGIGLATCQRIVEQHGGKINVESVLGQGTCFKVTLPRPTTEPQEEEADQQLAAPVEPKNGRHWAEGQVGEGSTYRSTACFDTVDRRGGGTTAVEPTAAMPLVSPTNLRILLAEDSMPNRRVALALLKLEGHTEVIVAENGRQAVEILKSQPIDIVLMDVLMPELDGFDATAEIRAHEAQTGGHVPIVALTAHALEGDRERCLQAGMDGYLSKPIRREKLKAVIEETLRHMGQCESHGQRPVDALCAADPGSLGADSPIPWEAICQAVGGDRQTLDEIVTAYLAEMEAMQELISAAIQAGDADRLCLAAHKLKSGLRFLRRDDSEQIAERLEQRAAQGVVDGAAADFAEINRHFSQLREAVTAYLQGARSGAADTISPLEHARS